MFMIFFPCMQFLKQCMPLCHLSTLLLGEIQKTFALSWMNAFSLSLIYSLCHTQREREREREREGERECGVVIFQFGHILLPGSSQFLFCFHLHPFLPSSHLWNVTHLISIGVPPSLSLSLSLSLLPLFLSRVLCLSLWEVSSVLSLASVNWPHSS